MYPRIRDLREDHDLTQTKLALLYNTSVDYILGLTNEKSPTVLITKHISQEQRIAQDIPGMGGYRRLPVQAVSGISQSYS